MLNVVLNKTQPSVVILNETTASDQLDLKVKLTESLRMSPSPATAVAQSRTHRPNLLNSPV